MKVARLVYIVEFLLNIQPKILISIPKHIKWKEECSRVQRNCKVQAKNIEESSMLTLFLHLHFNLLHYTHDFRWIERFSMQTMPMWIKENINYNNNSRSSKQTTATAKQSENKLCFITQKWIINRKTAIHSACACASSILRLLWLLAINGFQLHRDKKQHSGIPVVKENEFGKMQWKPNA